MIKITMRTVMSLDPAGFLGNGAKRIYFKFINHAA